MSGRRAGVFDAQDELDISGFVPKSAEKSAVQTDQVKVVAEAAHFRSREPLRTSETAAPSKREPRRYRTGRNIQINIKARAETIEAFYAIADRQGWVLGEVFEHAIEALKRDIPPEP